jgi:hypothetical protein
MILCATHYTSHDAVTAPVQCKVSWLHPDKQLFSVPSPTPREKPQCIYRLSWPMGDKDGLRTITYVVDGHYRTDVWPLLYRQLPLIHLQFETLHVPGRRYHIRVTTLIITSSSACVSKGQGTSVEIQFPHVMRRYTSTLTVPTALTVCMAAPAAVSKEMTGECLSRAARMRGVATSYPPRPHWRLQ